MKALVQRVVAAGRQSAGGAKELSAAIRPLVGREYLPQTVSAWERGRARPPAEVLLAIAQVTGTSVDELLFEESMASRQDRLEAELKELRKLVETRPLLASVEPHA